MRRKLVSQDLILNPLVFSSHSDTVPRLLLDRSPIVILLLPLLVTSLRRSLTLLLWRLAHIGIESHGGLVSLGLLPYSLLRSGSGQGFGWLRRCPLLTLLDDLLPDPVRKMLARLLSGGVLRNRAGCR